MHDSRDPVRCPWHLAGDYATKADRERLGMGGPLTPHALGHYFSDQLMKHGCDGKWNVLRGDIPHSNAKTCVHLTVDDVRRQYLRHAPRLA